MSGVWLGIESYAVSERRQAIEAGRVNTSNVARLFADHVRRITVAVDRLLIDFRAQLQAERDAFDIVAFVHRADAIRDLVVHVAATDPEGWVIVSTTGLPPRSIYVGDRPHFQHTRDVAGDDLTVSPPVRGRLTSRMSLQFQRRIVKPDGGFGGVAQISIDPVALSRFYASIDIGPGGSIALLREDGVKLATAPDADLAFATDGRAAEVANLRTQPGLDVTFADLIVNDAATVSTFRLVEDYPLAVRVSIAHEHLTRAAERRIRYYRYAGSVFTGLVLIGLFLAFRFERRLRATVREVESKSATLDATLRNVSQGIMMVDAAGCVLVTNEHLPALTGIPEAVLKPGVHLSTVRDALIATGELEMTLGKVDPLVQSFLVTGRWPASDGQVDVYERLRPNGQTIEVRTALLPGGGFVRTITDVSAARRMEHALRDNDRFLQNVADVAGVGGWECELKSRLPRWTAETRRIHEVPADYVPTFDSALEFYPPDARDTLREACQRARDDGQPFDLELPFVTYTGRHRWVRVTGRCDYKDGEPIRLIGAFSDVTDRRRAAEEMSMLSQIARQTTNGVVVTDLSGRITWVNPSFERMSGRSLADMIGQSPGKLLQGPDTNPETIAVMRQAIAERTDFNVEVLNYHLDGVPYWVSLACNPMFDNAGCCTGFMAIEVDITERKAQEAAIQRYARDLERFAHAASHDLQEPLRKIATHARLLVRALGEGDFDEARRCADVLETSAQRGRTIVDDILRYSKLKDNPVVRAHVRLDQIVADAIADIDVPTDVSVRNAVPHILANADAGLLAQVFQNLIGNAVKYRRPDAPLSVAVEARPDATDHALIVTVTDTGIGFDRAYKERIFQPFTRLVSRSQYPGTGIGLSLVRSILEVHGWSIEADSEPGKGSTFSIRIPRADIVMANASKAA